MMTTDPLASWNDGAAKGAIVDFIERVTRQGGSDLLPEAERIAVFDNDGTLWPEAPVPFQAAYVFDELKRRSQSEPKLAADPMVKAALAGDIATLLAGPHHDGLLQVLALTHAGMTTTEFDARVTDWLKTARHPRWNQPYDQLTYLPMQEMLAYLRANGFKTFIVSGGGADFMRVWAERVYGIPPEQVVGSTGRTRFELRDGQPVLLKTMDYLFVDDKAGKPVGIHQFIGRRPIVCVGNSDGDQAMLEYSTIANPRPSFGMIIHHTDAERFADQRFKVEASKAGIPEGDHVFSFEFTPTGKVDVAKGRGTPADIKLMIDGTEVGAGKLPVTIPLQLGLGGSVVTGADTGSPVMLAEDYKPPFAFTGTVKKALVDLSGEVTEDLEAKVKMYLARQ